MDTDSSIKKPTFKQNPTLIKGEVLKWELELENAWNGDLIISEPFFVDKMKWKLGLERLGMKLNVFLFLSKCETQGRGWICDASFKSQLYIQNGIVAYDFEFESHDFYHFCGSEKPDASSLYGFFILPEGTKNKDLIMVEVILDAKFFDFTTKLEKIPTVVLKVEDVIFNFNKYLLITVSKYFFELLIEQENDNQVVEINNVDPIDFTSFLGSICPIPLDITDTNFDSLLRIAERFCVHPLFGSIEKFLIDYPKIKETKKVQYADQYNLKHLLNDCVACFDSAKDVKTFTENQEFHGLKDETKLVILRSILRFPLEQFNHEQ